MSDMPVGETADSSSASAYLWHYYLTYALPLVFLIGVPSIFITRQIYYAHYPAQFVLDSPSISGTASDAPSSIFFEWTMYAVTLCIFISWSLNLFMNSARMARLSAEDRHVLLPALSGFACFSGIVAGVFLATLGLFTLNNGYEVHMYSSWIFYISQVLAILLDTILVFWLARLCAEHQGPTERNGRRARLVLGLMILSASLFFLFMYEVRAYLPKEDKYPAQLVFVASEYLVAVLCFSYPLTIFAEMRRHYREIAPTL